MSWRHGPHGRGPSRAGYHHGNLREALIEAALTLIAELLGGRILLGGRPS